MSFIVSSDFFAQVPEACFGVVVLRGFNPAGLKENVHELLEESIALARERFAGKNFKEQPEIAPYREAFRKLDINPNKFPPSVEALCSRVLKGGALPRINAVVDLCNAISIRYILPIGAHDLAKADGDMEVRFSREGDLFLPFGASETEVVPPGEPVYAAGNRVKTRRWIWRQSDEGKITEESRDIFIPIDGFAENKKAVLEARDRLAELFAGVEGCSVLTGFVDKEKPRMEF